MGVLRTCPQCGVEFKTYAAWVRRSRAKYCGRRCAGLAQRTGKHYIVRTGNRREHRVVWEEAHGPIPPGYHVHHVNGDKRDNRLENLALVTPQEHRHLHGATKATLTVDDVREIRRRYAAGGVIQRELGAEYGVQQAVVSKIIRRAAWADVT
jgi:hypothetical protein